MPLSGSGEAALYTGPSGELGDAQRCSGPNVDVATAKAAAVSNRMYFSGPVCHKTLRIQRDPASFLAPLNAILDEDKAVDVSIVDQCMNCEDGSIQISRPAFDELGVDPAGGAIQVSWTILDVDEDSDASSTESASETPSFTTSTPPEPSSPVSETEQRARTLSTGAIAGIAVAAVAALTLLALLLFFLLRRRRRDADETLDPTSFGFPPRRPTPPADKSEPPSRPPTPPAVNSEPPPPPQPARSESRSDPAREEVAQLHAAMRRAGFSVPDIIASLRDGAPPPAYESDDPHGIVNASTNR